MDDLHHCPTCGDDQPKLLGTLADTTWYRCRACGMEYFRTPEAREETIDDA